MTDRYRVQRIRPNRITTHCDQDRGAAIFQKASAGSPGSDAGLQPSTIAECITATKQCHAHQRQRIELAFQRRPIKPHGLSYVLDAAGSYDLVWLASIVLGLVAAILHWPIADAPLARAYARLPAGQAT